jgi:uncharacterized protein (TIGR03067 family)
MAADLDQLQGIWRVVTLEMDGRRMPAGAFSGAKIVVDGTRFTTLSMGARYEGRVELDPTKTPKFFDVIFTEGPEKGNTSRGIYQLEGDAWKICMTVTGSTRPQKFETTPGSGHALETLARETSSAVKPDIDVSHLESDPAIEGEWAMVSCTRDGEPLPKQMVNIGRRVARNHDSLVTFGTHFFISTKYSASAADKTVDYIHPDGAQQFGIYEVDGDTLKLCLSAPGEPRPAEFESQSGDGRTVAVGRLLKR